MQNNNNTLTFDNHDTYVYYVDEFSKSRQQVFLAPTNPDDTDIVRYTSREANLFTNGVNNGIIKLNSFNRNNLNVIGDINTRIGTIITDDGILMYNYASQSQSFLVGTQIKTLATYKSSKYANYINVEIQIAFEDTYNVITISY